MILNKDNTEQNKISNMKEISYDTLSDAIEDAIRSVVSNEKT